MFPLALLLWRRWIRSAGIGRWVFALWIVNLLAWMGSLAILTPTRCSGSS